MRRYKVGSKEEAGKFVRMLVESVASEKYNADDSINIAIPGGRSILPIITELGDLGKNTLNRLVFFLVDERVNGDKNSDSLFDNFFGDAISSGKLRGDQFVYPEIYDNMDKTISEYSSKIPEKFDVVIFGVGEDGHVASLFPGNEENKTDDRIIFISDSPKPPSKRISLTYNAFNADALYVLIFFGEDKKDALQMVVEGVEEEDCPASHFIDKKEVHIITNQNFG